MNLRLESYGLDDLPFFTTDYNGDYAVYQGHNE